MNYEETGKRLCLKICAIRYLGHLFIVLYPYLWATRNQFKPIKVQLKEEKEKTQKLLKHWNLDLRL